MLGIVLLLATALPAHADSGMSSSSAATTVLAQINQQRAARGLVALQVDDRLQGIAQDRATRLATHEILSHDIAGNMTQDLALRSVRWLAYGEVIGYASGTADAAMRSITRMWMASADHEPLLMSPRYNYVGVGVADGTRSGLTYSSVVLTEAPDRTGPRAAVTGAVASASSVRWTWSGSDVPLQSHTSGLRDFTVQLRMDHGAWTTIGTNLASTARTSTHRTRGHWYGLRVRARDRAGNLGPWSRERRIWLP